MNTDEEIALQRFDWEWKNGSRARAKELAKEYVLAGFERIAPALREKTLDELVKMVDDYRAAGRENDRIVVDMWIQSGCAAEGPSAVGKPTPPAVAVGAIGNGGSTLIAAAWSHGRRIEDKREGAKRFVDKHRDELQAALGAYTLPELVQLVDGYRAEDNFADQRVVEAWILAEYPPQSINGQLTAAMSSNEIEAALRRKRRLQ